MGQVPADFRASLPERPELPGVMDRRDPAAQEISPDAEDVSGVGNVVKRQALPVERQFSGLPFGSPGGHGTHDRFPGSNRFGEPTQRQGAGIRAGAGDNRDPVCGLSFDFEQLIRSFGNRLLPRDRLKCGFAPNSRAFHRATQTVGIVKALNTGLPAGTKATSTNVIQGVAFQLFNCSQALAELFGFARSTALHRNAFNDAFAIHHSCQNTTAGGAGGADGRMPVFDAGNQVLFGDEQGYERVGTGATAGGHGPG